jgi:hypothetical protein
VVGLAAGLGVGTARADPFHGKGRVSADVSAPAAARAAAVEQARRAALDVALSGMFEADPREVETARGAWSVWTGAYRVTSERTVAGVVEVDVEVELDVGRLAKALASATTGATTRDGGLRDPPWGWSWVFAPECAPEVVAAGRRGGQSTAKAVAVVVEDCRVVPWEPGSAEWAVRVRVALTEPPRDGGMRRRVWRVDGWGTGPRVEDGAATALAAARVALLERARRAWGGIELVVSVPASAPAIVRLRQTLAQGVAGVDAVALVGVGCDGSVHLRVATAATAAQLEARLREAPGLRAAGISPTILARDEDRLVISLPLTAAR